MTPLITVILVPLLVIALVAMLTRREPGPVEAIRALPIKRPNRRRR